MLNSLLAAFLISTASPVSVGTAFAPVFIHPPTVNLSAVRPLRCGTGSGTGFVIANDVLVTALHVAVLGNCKDAETGVPLVTYHEDPTNDFAIMTGAYPDGGPYIKYACGSYQKGRRYLSVGYRRMYRLDSLVATGTYSPEYFPVSGKNMPGMHRLTGGIVPGMSGGGMFDYETGRFHGINNVYSANRTGIITESYSYELKNTVLCRGQKGT